MKKLLIIMIALALIAGAGVMQAEAASTADISITVTLANIDVTLSPDWAIGTVVAGGTETTWTNTTAVGDGNFTATNEGTSNTAVDLDIKTGNSANWSPGDAANVDEFELYQGQTAIVGTDPCTNPVTTTDSTLTTGLGIGGTYKFDLKLELPPDGSSTAAQTIPVTISASIA